MVVWGRRKAECGPRKAKWGPRKAKLCGATRNKRSARAFIAGDETSEAEFVLSPSRIMELSGSVVESPCQLRAKGPT